MGRAAIDEQDHRYGRLVVQERVATPPGRKGVFWQCRCDCGTETVIPGSHLRGGHWLSCGCLRRDQTAALGAMNNMRLKHGHSAPESRTYSTWRNMINRCVYPSSPSFIYYGARGVTVCDRWLHSFEAFLTDMGERPEGHTIDRIDPHGDYEPSNCRWATPLEQAANRRAR